MFDECLGRFDRRPVGEPRELSERCHPSAYRTEVHEHPIAAAALELLLDATEGVDVESALVMESATYSTLQAGPEHQAWLATRSRRAQAPEDDAVLMARDGRRLRLTLNRPDKRNAFNAAMREGLLDGLLIATIDPAIEEIVINGIGSNFCSGGDLDEFGTLDDPATAHCCASIAVWLERYTACAIASRSSCTARASAQESRSPRSRLE